MPRVKVIKLHIRIRRGRRRSLKQERMKDRRKLPLRDDSSPLPFERVRIQVIGSLEI